MTSFPNEFFILMKCSPASHFCTSDHITESLEKRQRFNWFNIINFSKRIYVILVDAAQCYVTRF